MRRERLTCIGCNAELVGKRRVDCATKGCRAQIARERLRARASQLKDIDPVRCRTCKRGVKGSDHHMISVLLPSPDFCAFCYRAKSARAKQLEELHAQGTADFLAACGVARFAVS